MDIPDEAIEAIEKELARSAVIRFEYTVVNFKEHEEHLEPWLAKVGALGWELVQVLPGPIGHGEWVTRYFFKRRKL